MREVGIAFATFPSSSSFLSFPVCVVFCSVLNGSSQQYNLQLQVVDPEIANDLQLLHYNSLTNINIIS